MRRATVDQYITASFKREIEEAFRAFAESNPQAAESYASYLAEFVQHPRILFDHWWNEQEEYFT